MKISPVPQDIYQKHENEWQAIKQSSDVNFRKQREETPIWQLAPAAKFSADKAMK